MNNKVIFILLIVTAINILASMLGVVVISDRFTDVMLWVIFGVSLFGIVISLLFMTKD